MEFDLKSLSLELAEIKQTLKRLVDKEATKEWYEVEEFAAHVGKSAYTCREWCRLGRVHAVKKNSGRGQHCAWVISHEELLRYQREGLLPLIKAE